MVKRWGIRSVFLLPLLLCLAGWGTSYYWWIQYVQTGRPSCTVESFHGALVFEREAAELTGGFKCGRITPEMVEMEDPVFRFLGFGFLLHDTPDLADMRIIEVPYWFLVLVPAICFFVAWRKTRARNDPRTAFPVVTPLPAAVD